jgi:hypothetical protein
VRIHKIASTTTTAITATVTIDVVSVPLKMALGFEGAACASILSPRSTTAASSPRPVPRSRADHAAEVHPLCVE